VVYGMSTGEIHIAMGRDYGDTKVFNLELVKP
jgi:hypothetical protein